MKSSLAHLDFEWLTRADAAGVHIGADQQDVEDIRYPFPNESGHGGFEKHFLALGMALFRGEHHFTPPQPGRLIPLLRARVHFDEPSFMVQSVRGGRILHREQIPSLEHLCFPGLDIYRQAEAVDLEPLLDAGRDSSLVSLSIGRNLLGQLIGDGQSAQLLQTLGIAASPSIQLVKTPLSVSNLLHQALTRHLTGPMRKLHSQAKCLEYLAGLCHAFVRPPSTAPDRKAIDRAEEVRDYLLELPGKVPTLDVLAQHFGRSAQALNREFKERFGLPIAAYVSAQRLQEAHAAIANTATPLKVIAANLGYSHVNHFSNAFRRQFGYSPGALRKGALEGADASE